MDFFLVVDSLWVIVLLLFLGGTLVTVRVFLNGAREDADSPAFEALAHAATPPAAPAAAAPTAPDASAQAPAQAKARRRSAAGAAAPAAPAATSTAAQTRSGPSRRATSRRTPLPPPAWPGGDCPNCGSPTVPSAKFCGECGHRLTA